MFLNLPKAETFHHRTEFGLLTSSCCWSTVQSHGMLNSKKWKRVGFQMMAMLHHLGTPSIVVYTILRDVLFDRTHVRDVTGKLIKRSSRVVANLSNDDHAIDNF